MISWEAESDYNIVDEWEWVTEAAGHESVTLCDGYHEEVVGVEGEVIERGKPAITVNLLVTLGLTVYDYYARTSSRVVFRFHN